MRKIDCTKENPIDDFLLNGCDNMVDSLYNYGVTPNMVTIIGILFRIWSIYSLFIGNKLAFIIGGVLGYYCDCLDGHLARKYKMTSVVGDFLDHCSDILFQIGILFYLFTKRDEKLFLPIIVIYVVMSFMLMIHMGCQQRHYNGGDDAETLDFLRYFCTDKEWIYNSRYFGSGTFTGFSILAAAII